MAARGPQRALRAPVRLAGRLLPRPAVARVQALRRDVNPRVGLVRLGGLRRLTPISDVWGFDRGLPVDRYYVEDWLRRFGGEEGYAAGDIRGRVLEIGDDAYTRRFGRDVERIDVLHVNPDNPKATIVGDVTEPGVLPDGAFDCIVCLQTLHIIYDFRAALTSLHAALKPGGVLLATVPGITRACSPDRYLWGDWWRFTTGSAKRVVEEAFGPDAPVTVEAYGNVLSAVSFLHGLAAEELKREELDLRDPDFEVIVGIRAVRSGG